MAGLQKEIVKSLRDVMGDSAAPAAARASAARTLAEIEGMLGKHQEPPTPETGAGAGMSTSDIDKEIANLKREISGEKS